MVKRLRWYWLVLLVAVVGAAAVPNPFPPGSLTTTTLPNGLRVIVREDHSLPVVAMVVVVRGGSSASENTRGSAHYLEHLIFQGSTRYPEPLSAQYALEAAGGVTNGVTTRDMTRVQAVMPSAEAELLAGVLADITLRPLLTREAFQQERPIILAEIQRAWDQLLTPAVNGAYLLTYVKHPYKHLPTGTISDVLELSYEDVVDFHRQWYVPNNMSVILVGDITQARALALVRKEFGNAAKAALPARPAPEPPRPRDPARMHFTRDASGTYQVMSFPAPAANDYAGMVVTDVLTMALVDGADSVLPARWAQAGLAAEAFGIEFVSMRDPGRCLIWAKTSPREATRLHDVTLAYLQELRTTPLPAAVVDAARTRLATQFLLQNETYSQQAVTLAFYEALGDAALAGRYLPAIDAVTPDAVRRAVPESLLGWITVGERVEETP